MAEKVIMPQLGLTMTEGDILRWIKREGDQVIKGEAILEIESDKATFEIEAPCSGTLLKIMYDEGIKVPISEAIAYIGEPGEKIDEDKTEKIPQAAIEDEREDLQIKEDVPNKENSGRVFVSPRARMAAEENHLSETDLKSIKGRGPGGRIIEEDVIDWIKEHRTRATPLAQKIAGDNNIDLSKVKGSDVGGKVVSKDVQRHIINLDEEPKRIISLEGIRKVTANRMLESWQMKPHVTLTTEVDMSDIVQLRKQINSNNSDLSVSYNDILIKVCAIALKKHPNINAKFIDEQIHFGERINIGLAIAVEKGLVVTVVGDADTKSLKQISWESKERISKAREGSLSIDEMSGGTFTISNLGMYNIDAFTPIINPPETAILGVGRLKKKPVVTEEDTIVIRTMMWFSLSFDHRVVDGAPAAAFLNTIRELLEDPYKLILEI